MSASNIDRTPKKTEHAGSNEGPPENMRSIRIQEKPRVNLKMVQSIKREV